jgi:porin
MTQLPAGLVGLAVALSTASSAWAQLSNNGVGAGPSQQASQPEAQLNVAPTVEHLFGDLGGMRSNLENQGIFLLLDATAEFAGNVSGGTKQGATSANQVGLEIDIDWQRLADITGLSTHVILVNRTGANDSNLFGDHLVPVQEIYGSGGNVAVHLVSAYAQEKWFGGALDVAAGWMNVENDFASSPLYCNYMNNGLCGDPKALPGGDIGHSAYPNAVWAGRVRVRPVPEIYVQVGLYEVNQGLYTEKYDNTGFEFNEPAASGVYVPVEAAYEPRLGSANMPGHYKIGFGYDSSSTYKDFSSALVPPNTPVPTRSGNTQTWILLDQMLLRQGPGNQDGLIALGGFVRNDPNRSSYAEQYYAGLLDRGFWAERPQDTVGLLFNYNTVSGVLGKTQALEAEFGIPFSNQATGVQTHEMVIEANYNIHVFRGVNFQPDFQYVIRPNAQANIHNATVLAFRAHVEF